MPASNPHCDGNIKEHSFLFQLSALAPELLFFLPLDLFLATILYIPIHQTMRVSGEEAELTSSVCSTGCFIQLL